MLLERGMGLYIRKSQNTFFSGISDMYLHDFSRIKQFYEYDFRLNKSFQDRVGYVKSNSNIQRQELVKALLQINLKMNANEKTLGNINKLRDNDVLTVVTGQQPGILTGPLYTVYKAISAVILSDYLTKEMGINAVPVFWIAGEDHDFYEIASTFYPGVDGVRKLNIDMDHQIHREDMKYSDNYLRYSVGTIPISMTTKEMVYSYINEFSGYQGKEYMDILRDTVDGAMDINHWFGSLMLNLFKNHGLIVADSMDSCLKEISKEVYVEAIEKHEDINKVIDIQNEALKRQSGYTSTINVRKGNTNLFYYSENKRLPLLREEGGFKSDTTTYWNNEQDLKKSILKKPQDFSPNVVIRPIVQDKILPTIAYIAGPGEISYLGALKGVYELFDMKMPVIYPRNVYTVIEPDIKCLFDKYGLNHKHITDGSWERIQQIVLENTDHMGIKKTFMDMKNDINNIYKQVGEKIKKININLKDLCNENNERVTKQIEYLEDKALQHHKRNNKQLIKDFNIIKNNIFPKNNYQERIYNIFYFLCKYGINLVDRLIKLSDLETDHKMVFIEEKDII